MKSVIRLFAVLVSGILLVTLLSGCSKKEDTPIVVMLSMDGFRWDYPEMYSTPNLDKLETLGVRATSLIPSFPSKTFPNHYTMATGLYPDHHGLVNNTFYAPEKKIFYRISDRKTVEDPSFYGGEPIWVTAEKQGIKTASFFWVGSEAAIKGIKPSIWKKYDSSIPFEDRMDSVICWLNLPEKQRPGLITWYMEEPDHTGHAVGPFGEETGKVISSLDSIVGIFINKINALPHSDRINLIITSDHGMGEIHGEKYINIKSRLKDEWIDYIIGYNPVILVQPHPEFLDSTLSVLQSISHLSAWKKEDIPEKLIYGTNPGIADIVVAADSAWSIGVKDEPGFITGGTHGYDPSNTDMHAIFYAKGPAFKKNYSQPSFRNVDIYLLISEILNITPEESDGDYQRIKGMFIGD